MAEEMNNATQVGGQVFQGEPQGEPQNESQTEAKVEPFDYEKVASILDGKIKATEESVLKGYFKQQGLTGEEMSQAIEMFKEDKASRQPDVGALNKQIADLDEQVIEAQSRALYAETQMEAMSMASELGVDSKVIPFLLNSADLTSVITDGQVDQEKLKGSLSEILEKIPQLKLDKEEKPAGFKIGADTSEQKPSTNEELAKIFGVSKKG